VHQYRVLGDEGSAATAGDDEVLGGQGGDGLAHGVPVHAETLGKLALGRQFRPWHLSAADDLATQLLGDEPPGGVSAAGPALSRHDVGILHNLLARSPDVHLAMRGLPPKCSRAVAGNTAN
jgi:hypothetical protein